MLLFNVQLLGNTAQSDSCVGRCDGESKIPLSSYFLGKSFYYISQTLWIRVSPVSATQPALTTETAAMTISPSVM